MNGITGNHRHLAHMGLRAAAALFCAVAVSGLVTACGTKSTGGPPTVECGTTLWSGEPGPIVQDVSHGGTVTHVSVAEYLFLRVSESCTIGVDVQIQPSSAAQVITTARSGDGRASAVVLAPARHAFTIKLSPARGKTKLVTVNVAYLPHSTSSSHVPTQH